jgi:predicted  nucleic acid-binding Zn-ribbon protein/CheY-like chemotaxis protein
MALGSDAAASEAAPEPGPGGNGPPTTAPQAPEELIEVQLRAILEATQTSAGAVCLFDQHQELLRLAVEVGLSDEGCRRLRTVRRGAATTWDMPLHSLLNRRVYLIESAAKNRYVPPLVDEVAMVRAVACIPLYDGSTPVGSLILVALAPRTFGERQIRMLEQPVRELVGHIIAMRKRVSAAVPQRSGRPSLSATSLVRPAAAVAVAGPTTPGPKTVPGTAASPAGIQATVDRARAEIERLHARLAETEESLKSERGRADALAELQQELQARISELGAERERLSEALAARTHETHVLQDRVAALEADVAQARAAEAALRADLEHARSSGAAAASEEAAAVDGLKMRLGELEATHDRLRDRVRELEEAEAAARAEAEQRLAAAADDAEREYATAIAALEARLATLVAERAALDGELATTRDAHERALADVTAEHERVRGELEARAATAEHAAADWQRRCESLEAELATTRAAGGSQDEQADALARERARWEAELGAARQREAALEQRVAELEAELERARREGAELRDGFANLESLIQAGIATGQAPVHAGTVDLTDGTSFEVVELDGSGTADAAAQGLEVGALSIEALEPAAAAASPGATGASTAHPEGLLVLDTDDGWSQAAPAGTRVAVLSPEAVDGTVSCPAEVLVNLAAPNALVGLAGLRRAGIAAPCVACIAVPGQGRGLMVGRFELATRPIDPDALLATLRGVFIRGKRVVTAGADVDGLISLRQALARLGVSVSMAWDAKQAGDLLAMVHPDVAIIDLELPPKDGCVLVARMGLLAPAPFTVVIPKTADTAGTFAAAVAHPELARATLPAKELLARTLGLVAEPAPTAARR